jgi:four helix bundle protein
MAKSFEDLEVWKRGCRQAVNVYRTLESDRHFSLRDQMERAAVSVPSNIAEGQERDSNPDFMRFLRIAKGSNGELRTQLYIARELGIIDESTGKQLVQESREISKMLQGLIQSLKRAGSTSLETGN